MRYTVALDLQQSGIGRIGMFFCDNRRNNSTLCLNGRTVSFIIHAVFCLEGKQNLISRRELHNTTSPNAIHSPHWPTVYAARRFGSFSFIFP